MRTAFALCVSIFDEFWAAYTISRAILSDIISLIRGDRFFTAEFTPFNMTAWGFQDCQRDPLSPGFGSTLGRLFLRTLPNDFQYDSVYTWFPFLTPEMTKLTLRRLGLSHSYDFEKPRTSAAITNVVGYRSVAEVLKSPDRFGVAQHDRTSIVKPNAGYALPVTFSRPGLLIRSLCV